MPRHHHRLAGEIDFLVAVPGLGVLCLEVKAHKSVGRDADGIWHLGHDKPTRVGPFRQASEAMHSLRSYITGEAPELGATLFWSAVCFTTVPFTFASPAEWHHWQVIDLRDLRSSTLPQIITGVLFHARTLAARTESSGWFDAGAGAPTPADIDRIVNILRPSFEFYQSPKARRRQLDGELVKYTEEQYSALDAMAYNQRVVFEGAAGTGKTLLALEESRRGVLRGERVLLCCFNRLLGGWLKREAEPLGRSAVASTLHSLMLQLAGLSVPDNAPSSFWEQDLPYAALEGALSGDIAQFDLLIVDEAQDVLTAAYLDFLDALVAGGLKQGRWRMFGDFERQSIYGTPVTALAATIAERSPGTPLYILTKNCRNPPRIASLVKLLAAYDHGYSAVLRQDNGIEPEIIYCDSPDDEDSEFAALLSRLSAEGYGGSEIVILSPRARGSAAQRARDPRWSGRLKPVRDEISGGPSYCTVHSFKGLEAPVIIVTDVSAIGTDADNSLLYTALTRATDRLYIMASSHLKQAVRNLLLSRPLSEGNHDGP